MRWLVRSMVLWAIMAPLFYFFGLPMLMEKLSKQTQTQTYTQCLANLKQQGLMDSDDAPISTKQGEHYCHCMSDGLTFTKPDIIDALHKRPPAALSAQAKAIAQQCNEELKATLAAQAPIPL